MEKTILECRCGHKFAVAELDDDTPCPECGKPIGQTRILMALAGKLAGMKYNHDPVPVVKNIMDRHSWDDHWPVIAWDAEESDFYYTGDVVETAEVCENYVSMDNEAMVEIDDLPDGWDHIADGYIYPPVDEDTNN